MKRAIVVVLMGLLCGMYAGANADKIYAIGADDQSVMIVQGLDSEVTDHARAYKRPENAADIQISLITKDGRKWHAVWVEDCMHTLNWKDSHKKGEILLDMDLTDPGKNIYVMARSVKRGALMRAEDIAALGYAAELKKYQLVPGWLIAYMMTACQ